MACALLTTGFSGCSQPSGEDADKVNLQSFTDETSYVLGVDIGSSLRETGTEVNQKALSKGIDDSLNGRELLLDPEKIESIKQQFAAKIQGDYEAKTKELAESNSREGKIFLEANKGNEGVVTTDSGLQYKVLQEGDGASPSVSDRVSVHYRGTLLSGKEFDSSYERGEPVAFNLDKVIPGWTEALQLMKVGSKYQLFIPAELAYGDRGVGPDIGPNSTLIFEVELLGIE